jgi:hypothetical protein
MLIYSLGHQIPKRPINTPLFKTFVSGVKLAGINPDIHTDELGEGIPNDNRYSEMRHQYHTWKNFPASHNSVGFEHYRRAFLLTAHSGTELKSKYPNVFELCQMSAVYGTHHFLVNSHTYEQNSLYRESWSSIDIERITEKIESFDIVTVRPEYISVEKMSTGPWNRITSAASQTHFMKKIAHLGSFVPHLAYWLNCYILKKDFFDEYMEFAFETIANYESGEATEIPNESRLFGHITERLFSIYLQQKRLENPHLKVLEVPTIWLKFELDPDKPSISHDFRFELAQAEKRGGKP